jgi:hypothetical protein
VPVPTGKTVWLENMASTVEIEHNGAGSLVVRHLAPVSGTGGTVAVTTGPSATGKLFLENWGPHSRLTITRPVHVWARQMNREGQNWSISGGATVWVMGDNVETRTGRGHPVVTIANSTYEVIGGAWDNLGDSTSYPRSGAAVYQATDSRISLVIAGLMRDGGSVGHWISDRRSGSVVGDVFDDALGRLLTRGSDRRVVCPLYVSSVR